MPTTREFKFLIPAETIDCSTSDAHSFSFHMIYLFIFSVFIPSLLQGGGGIWARCFVPFGVPPGRVFTVSDFSMYAGI